MILIDIHEKTTEIEHLKESEKGIANNNGFCTCTNAKLCTL